MLLRKCNRSVEWQTDLKILVLKHHELIFEVSNYVEETETKMESIYKSANVPDYFKFICYSGWACHAVTVR